MTAKPSERTADCTAMVLISCLGKNLALVEVYKAVFAIVDGYDIRLLRPDKMWKEETKRFFLMKSDMMVQVTKRNTLSSMAEIVHDI
jgi:hypothetical protein